MASKLVTRWRVELWRPDGADRLRPQPHWHHVGLFNSRERAEAFASTLKPGKTLITEERSRRYS
jgi:hypothetical protein